MRPLRIILLITPLLLTSSQVSINPPSQSMTLLEGVKFTLTCTNPNHHPNIPPHYPLRWEDPSGKRISNHSGRRHISRDNLDHPETIELKFKKILPSDAGTYSCSYDNFLNKTLGTASIKINTIPPVNFSETPNKLYFKKGDNATLTCKTQSTPYLRNIIWSRNNKRIEPNGKFNIDPEKPETLHIFKINQTDGGAFKCQTIQITSDASISNSKTLLVEIHDKPSWLSPHQLQNQTLNMNTNILIPCTVESKPQSAIFWYHENKRISNSSNITITHTLNNSSLNINLRSHKDFGQYSCKALNRYGSITKHFFLNLRTDPTQHNPTQEPPKYHNTKSHNTAWSNNEITESKSNKLSYTYPIFHLTLYSLASLTHLPISSPLF